MSLDKAVSELEKALLDSSEYANLILIKREITRNPKIASLLAAFEKKQDNLNAAANMRPEQIQSIIDEINSDFEKLGSIPEIKRYFNGMDTFNQLWDSVINRLQTSITKTMRN